MKKTSGYLSVLLGTSILASVFLGIGGFAYSFYRSEAAKAEKAAFDLAKENSDREQLEEESNVLIVPVPKQEGGERGIELESSDGIPTGTYSSPPTSIYSTGSSLSTDRDRPLTDSNSSVERNRLSQENFSDTVPDYSSPSSSNNFNLSREDSAIEPLENSDPLSPSTTNDSTETSSFDDSDSPFSVE